MFCRFFFWIVSTGFFFFLFIQLAEKIVNYYLRIKKDIYSNVFWYKYFYVTNFVLIFFYLYVYKDILWPTSVNFKSNDSLKYQLKALYLIKTFMIHNVLFLKLCLILTITNSLIILKNLTYKQRLESCLSSFAIGNKLDNNSVTLRLYLEGAWQFWST